MTERGAVLPRAVCPACGRECSVQPPRGGDGSVDVFPRHTRKYAPSGLCSESRQIVERRSYVEKG